MSYNNGLTLSKVKSKVKIIEFNENNLLYKINKIFRMDGFYIAYLDYGILMGRYIDKNFKTPNDIMFKKKFIQKIRIFNEQQELLIWKSNGVFLGRCRKDGDSLENGTETDIVVSNQVLFGTRISSHIKDEYTILTEERGTEIILPFLNLHIKENDIKSRVKIKTINYIGYNSIHHAEYIDSRFTNFTFGIENKVLD